MDTLLLNANGLPLSEVPLSVISWQVAMRLVYLDKVRVLKEYDNWVIHSQRQEHKVPSIVMMTEHVKWNRGPKYNRGNIFLRDNFTCQLQSTWKCKEKKGKVKVSDLTLDHVVPRSRGGKSSWINVCTSCKECNSSKGNNETIIPKIKPYKPSYYELLSKRKQFPIFIKDEEWMHFIDWPEDLIRLIPHKS